MVLIYCRPDHPTNGFKALEENESTDLDQGNLLRPHLARSTTGLLKKRALFPSFRLSDVSALQKTGPYVSKYEQVVEEV